MKLRLAVIVVLTAVAALVWAPQASALSCAVSDPYEQFAAAEAAFVGVIVAAEVGQPDTGPLPWPMVTPLTYRFRIDEVYKSAGYFSAGQTVDFVQSWSNIGGWNVSASPYVVGGLAGRLNGRWVLTSEGCNTISADALRRAATTPPPPPQPVPLPIPEPTLPTGRVVGATGQGRALRLRVDTSLRVSVATTVVVRCGRRLRSVYISRFRTGTASLDDSPRFRLRGDQVSGGMRFRIVVTGTIAGRPRGAVAVRSATCQARTAWRAPPLTGPPALTG